MPVRGLAEPVLGANRARGQGFEQLKAYTANKGRVSAIIQIPALKEETYGRDFAEMLQDRRTFDEALADSALTIMTRQRLKIVKPALRPARKRGGALMAADDKIEELIREIAAKHGIAVGRDDPDLDPQTINMKLMQDSASAQQEILDAFKSELGPSPTDGVMTPRERRKGRSTRRWRPARTP